VRIIVVANANAGRGRGQEIADALSGRWRARGDEVTIEPTQRRGHAIELARDAQCDRLVVFGGDGTLREVAAGLAARRAEIPVVLVPSGHGNVIAREFGIPLADPTRAAAAVDSTRERALDVGVVNDRVFLAMVGVGFDVFAVRFVDWARGTRVGRWLYDVPFGGDALYCIGGAAGFLRFAATRFALTIDGRELAARFPTITICNTRTYAKGWSLTPDARPDDAILDVNAQCFCNPVAQLLALLLGRLGVRMPRGLAVLARGAIFEIRAPRPVHWQLDGDPQAATDRLRIGVDSPPLRLLVND
jgi:diacylglycerol kinase (ATP)